VRLIDPGQYYVLMGKSMKKSDVRIEYTKGQGPGGQHKNKTSSCVKVTHLATGIIVRIDGRSQHKNKRDALREVERRLRVLKQKKLACRKKAHRDKKIHERDIIRTYDYKANRVKDHRTGKTASIKDILDKGKLGLLQP